ncbi:hypothetical protein EMIHUDRAFT_461968 [Emiliania huxleyi CCMP1516]|uniref:TFIIS-type domain-containing protein n=2 Tax=Emiliania huxleyi TaxID=2903 RepID=A0A0D3I250_EMIH1|nr:hypothetical protein EMIHUDRAFT_461968 [Emiliania huxleyi CCMP1516]EOD05335.1 hypothetical protein EMIHUDRAFT_461968 [Emiliania huxleyi CCMP1516]|eukprot:XP_005757764.1 hypothetical protein EMIHUDRAFT_461968 [Emiliania huxleyi CCMP1516]
MLGLIILPALPRPLASVQGGAPAWTVRSADERRQLRGPVALRSPPVVASFHASSGAASPVANGADFMTAQGGCRSWSVRGADERRQLRRGNAAPDRAAITRTTALAEAGPVEAGPVEAGPAADGADFMTVQGGCSSWSVRGADERRQLRGGNVAPDRAAITRAAAAPANKAGPANSAQASVAAVQPLSRKRMPGAPRDAALAWWAEDPEHASVQGGCGNWSVQGGCRNWCPKCKSMKTSYVEVQTRSADEPTTKKCLCTDCTRVLIFLGPLLRGFPHDRTQRVSL